MKRTFAVRMLSGVLGALVASSTSIFPAFAMTSSGTNSGSVASNSSAIESKVSSAVASGKTHELKAAKFYIGYSDGNIYKSTFKSHDDLEHGVVLTGMHAVVQSADGKETYDNITVSDSMLEKDDFNSTTMAIPVKVPDVTDGAKYRVLYTQVPKFMSSSGTAVESVVCDNGVGKLDADGKTIAPDPSIYSVLKPEMNLACITVVNTKHEHQSGVKVTFAEYDAGKNLLVNQACATDKNGIAYFQYDDKATLAEVSYSGTADGKKASHAVQFDPNSVIDNGVLNYTYVSDEEVPDDGLGDLIINTNIKHTYSTDIFKPSSVVLNFINAGSVSQTVAIDKSGTQHEDTLIVGQKYKEMGGDAKTSDYDITSTSFTMGKSTSISVTATPKCALKVVGYVGGKYQFINAEPVSGKVYSDSSKIFDVNTGTTYTVKDINSGKEYNVVIDASSKMTTINMKTGDVSVSGKTGAAYDVNNGIPKTGDVMLIILVLAGVVVIGVLGYKHAKAKNVEASSVLDDSNKSDSL